MIRSKVSRNLVLLAPPSCGEVSANKSANEGALIFIITLFGSVLIISHHPPFVQRFLKKPEWLKIKISPNRQTKKGEGILLVPTPQTTFCEQACCPNLGEFFNVRRASFLIRGNFCTRR